MTVVLLYLPESLKLMRSCCYLLLLFLLLLGLGLTLGLLLLLLLGGWNPSHKMENFNVSKIK